MPAAPDHLHLVRDLDGISATRQSRAAAARAGLLHRVARGAYINAATWSTLTARERYVMTVHAIGATRRSHQVLSNESAAAIHGLPLIGIPRTVHLSVPTTASRPSNERITTHAARLRESDIVEVEGLRVTSLIRTVVDLAAVAPFASAVAVVDAAILVDRWGRHQPMTTRTQLLEQWAAMQPLRAHSRARTAIDFGEDRSESPLESVSRVSMWVLGAPAPRLQAIHRDDEGDIGYSDFYWPEHRAIGEADGDSKYLDPGLRGTKTAEQVILDEKHREDRLRAITTSFTRWRWEQAANPQRLRPKLEQLGLPLGKRWPITHRDE